MAAEISAALPATGDASADALTPALRGLLATLRLRPRRALGRQGLGHHASRNRGSGQEFAQYRAYESGDEPRQIDWKLYARSDRFFVREAERESPVRAWLLLDTTASMAQADEARPQFSRFDAARQLAVCVFEIAQRQGDACGLVLCGGSGLSLVTPGSGPRQRDRLRHALATATAIGEWPKAEVLAPAWGRIGRGDLVIALGDCFDEAAVAQLVRLAHAGREVVALQVLTADERDFPFADGRRFVEPEAGESLLGDGPALRADYLARFAAAQRTLSARFAAAGIRHATHVIDQSPGQALQQLFGDRAR
ncbi:DUF58 domain-containing protein [Luteimonas terrae]|uniref:Uncharacterized protein (DUF58 family) n=1 Tax=Luteimonas terrae TaxID=1530191 RepID=A0ABU1XRE6_9GAMM|nr:DUF58 domain-containing protein [Luteimonas terrae]MDR7191339.1 uncharacterized protein (DUF58 family) [Luteimonas terrae]